MKRFVILGAVVAALFLLLLLVWPRGDSGTSTPETSEATSQALVSANSTDSSEMARPQSGRGVDTGPMPSTTNQDNKLEQLIRKTTEAANLPVAFYGLVVDQDSNVLQNVSVDLEVVEERLDSFPQNNQGIWPLQRQTDAEGRFNVIDSGLKGRMIGISKLTKAGYEPEFPGQGYGPFGTQSTSFENPAVLRMWRTNLHEPLIGGEKSFDLVPDGRHYVIDLKNGTITEGETGDLVVWMKRPPTVVRGERFAWSCEVSVPSGGLLESESQAMFVAPESGYTNLFTFQEQESDNGSGSLQDKRFYIRLSNGMYGRIVISLYPNFHRTKAGLILISYAVNPSGSRLLR